MEGKKRVTLGERFGLGCKQKERDHEDQHSSYLILLIPLHGNCSEISAEALVRTSAMKSKQI